MKVYGRNISRQVSKQAENRLSGESEEEGKKKKEKRKSYQVVCPPQLVSKS